MTELTRTSITQAGLAVVHSRSWRDVLCPRYTAPRHLAPSELVHSLDLVPRRPHPVGVERERLTGGCHHLTCIAEVNPKRPTASRGVKSSRRP